MPTVKIEENVVAEIGQKLLEMIQASDELSASINSLSSNINASYVKGASPGMQEFIDKIQESIETVKEDSIERNKNDILQIGEAFEKADKELQQKIFLENHMGGSR